MTTFLKAPIKVFEMDGARVEIPAPCACGAICTDQDVKRHLWDWNKSGDLCSFCGTLIRVAALKMKHHHLLGPKDWSPIRKHPHLRNPEEEARWASEDWAQYEPNWQWMAHSHEYTANIKVHISCAMKGMPHGNFRETVYNRPQFIPEAFGLPEAHLDPCAVCGVLPTEEDLARGAARIYSFLGPCVYCGEPIRVKSIKLTHGSWGGEHTGHWHFDTYKREDMLMWCGYSIEGSTHSMLEFTGHESCAMKAMSFMKIWKRGP